MLVNMKISRVRKNITQKELSKLSGVSTYTINQLEQGKRDIDSVSFGTLRKISEILNISVEELIKNEN